MSESKQINGAPHTKRGLQSIAAIWALAIAFLSLLPAKSSVSVGLWDKLEHGIAYGVLAILIKMAWSRIPGSYIWIGISCYGLIIEFGQLYSPGRQPDAADAAANALGTLFGLGLIYLLKRWKN